MASDTKGKSKNTSEAGILILFGGGDAGGIIIKSTGVRPIPPFDPSVLLHLRGVGAMVHALENTLPDIRRKMTPLVHNLSNLAIEQVEQIIGPLQGEHSLIYQDKEGGFSCGSAGQPAIPFAWPPVHVPQIKDIITHEMMDLKLNEFLEAARDRGLLLEVFENPEQVAQKLKFSLTKQLSQDLKLLAPSQLSNIKDPIARELVEFFQQVIKDGRYLQTWATRPYEVSKELGVSLSDSARDFLISAGTYTYRGLGVVPECPACVAVAVAVVIVTWSEQTEDVIDSSGKPKF